MDAEPPILIFSDVNKRYDSNDSGPPVSVLSGIGFQLQRGESLAVIGPSGSGKSTLLHLAGTLDQPSSGRVELEGQDLSRLGEDALAEVRNRRIGFIFQSHHLLPQCSVLENVLVPTLAGRDPALRRDAETRARQLLDRVGLGARLSHRPSQLSGGERQRVAVVRALMNRPVLVLADEPTGALDQDTARQLGQLLCQLNREERVTLLVVTHSIELASHMDRILELREGKLHPWQPSASAKHPVAP